MKELFGVAMATLLILNIGFSQTRLLVRMDDMGISHGTNVACIEGYKNGVGTSVEVIVPGPWFEEAVVMLNEHPDLDVGVHLALTSEWANLKWRPLTECPSLVDEDGYFLPMVWPNENYDDKEILQRVGWSIDEMEKELRAQIELALKKIPHISHLSQHMACLNITAETKALLHKLGKDYNLKVAPIGERLQGTPKWGGKEYTSKQKEDYFLNMLTGLDKAQDYIVVTHPITNSTESKAIGLDKNDEIATDRSGDLYVLMSNVIRRALKEQNIQLINYKDLD